MNFPNPLNNPTQPLEENLGRHPTRERLLDAAETLFAERGFKGTSMRAITNSAGCSVSAANYHFGSKESLLRETLRRHIEPINQSRIEKLDKIETSAAGKPLSIESILEAFLLPLFERRMASSANTNRYRQIAAQLFLNPPEITTPLKTEFFGSVSKRFLDALQRSLPQQSEEEVALHFQFCVGIMVHVMSGNLETAPNLELPPHKRSILSANPLLQNMIRFMADGLKGYSQ